MVEAGTHAELIGRDGIYARLCRSQALADLDGVAKRPAVAEPTEAV